MQTITSLDESTIADLKDLVRINTDSARGFRKAAGEVRSARIASFLRANAEERERFAVELAALLRMSDEDVEDIGSVRGAAHRWWIGLRGLVAGGDEHPILAEAERGEDAIRDRYEAALRKAGDNPIHETLRAHYASIQLTHDRVRAMRDAR